MSAVRDKARHVMEVQQAELAKLENRIEDMERNYLSTESSQIGNVFKGFEGFISAKDARKSRQQKVAAKDEYLFSLSSTTSSTYVALQQSLAAQEQDMYGNGTGKRYAQKGYYATKGSRVPYRNGR